MENNNVDTNTRTLRSGRVLMYSNNSKKPTGVEVDSLNNQRKRNFIEGSELRDQQVDVKKIKPEGNRLTDGRMTVHNVLNAVDEKNDMEEDHEECSTINNSIMSLQKSVISLGKSPTPHVAICKSQPTKLVLSPTPASGDERDDLRVTPDFDIATTNEEILNYINLARKAPKRKKPSSRKRAFIRYFNRSLKFPFFTTSRRDSGLDSKPAGN